MWYKLSLAALLALCTTDPAGAQQPYYPPSRHYPLGHARYPYGRPYAPPPSYGSPSQGGYGQQLPPQYPQQAPQQDPRQSWSYGTGVGGTFQHTQGNQWQELRNGLDPIPFVEVTRTPQYVEITDPQRNLGVRLYPDQLWQTTPQGTWEPVQPGQWD